MHRRPFYEPFLPLFKMAEILRISSLLTPGSFFLRHLEFEILSGIFFN
jgi:hypothetical protein